MKKKLAIITTHPIQYNAPWFALLAKEPGLEIKVFYTWSQRQTDLFDEKFGKAIEWDIPLLEGYNYTFVENTSKKPGTKSFWGIQCPTLIPQIRDYSPTHILIFGWNFQAHFKVMRYYKGKIPVLFRGDSTLLDYKIKSIKELISNLKNQVIGFRFKDYKKMGKEKAQRSLLKTTINYLKYKIRQAFLTFIYHYIDVALYVGQNNKAYFQAHCVKRHQLAFVPHAIDNKRFFDNPDRQYEEKAQHWRQQLGFSKDDIVLLYTGKFETKKDPIILLKSFKQLTVSKAENSPNWNTNCNLKLLIIGDGSLLNELKHLAQDIPGTIFLPFQNQSKMPIVYRLANIVCLPSKGPGETWGLVVNEALACGRPVITSDMVGCAANLTTPPNRIFKADNIDDLMTQIIILTEQINNHNIRNDQLQNLISYWSFETIVKTIQRIIVD